LAITWFYKLAVTIQRIGQVDIQAECRRLLPIFAFVSGWPHNSLAKIPNAHESYCGIAAYLAT